VEWQKSELRAENCKQWNNSLGRCAVDGAVKSVKERVVLFFVVRMAA